MASSPCFQSRCSARAPRPGRRPPHRRRVRIRRLRSRHQRHRRQRRRRPLRPRRSRPPAATDRRSSSLEVARATPTAASSTSAGAAAIAPPSACAPRTRSVPICNARGATARTWAARAAASSPRTATRPSTAKRSPCDARKARARRASRPRDVAKMASRGLDAARRRRIRSHISAAIRRRARSCASAKSRASSSARAGAQPRIGTRRRLIRRIGSSDSEAIQLPAKGGRATNAVAATIDFPAVDAAVVRGAISSAIRVGLAAVAHAVAAHR